MAPVVVGAPAAPLMLPAGYRTVTKDTTSVDADIIQALVDATRLAEDVCNRTLGQATYSENLRVYRDGKVYPTATPLVGIVSPVSAGVLIQGAGIYLGTFHSTPMVTVAGFSGAIPPQTTVVYVGGYTQATLPVTLARALARIAWHMLHPVVLDGVPAGATSVHVGDTSVGGPLMALAATDAGILTDLGPYTRRQVVGW